MGIIFFKCSHLSTYYSNSFSLMTSIFNDIQLISLPVYITHGCCFCDSDIDFIWYEIGPYCTSLALFFFKISKWVRKPWINFFSNGITDFFVMNQKWNCIGCNGIFMAQIETKNGWNSYWNPTHSWELPITAVCFKYLEILKCERQLQ